MLEHEIEPGMISVPASPAPSHPTVDGGEDMMSSPKLPNMGGNIMERTTFRGQALWKYISFERKAMLGKGVELTHELLDSLANATEKSST